MRVRKIQCCALVQRLQILEWTRLFSYLASRDQQRRDRRRGPHTPRERVKAEALGRRRRLPILRYTKCGTVTGGIKQFGKHNAPTSDA